MTNWQRGYSDGYLSPKVRGYPELPDDDDYMDGYMCGQEEYAAHNQVLVVLLTKPSGKEQ